MFSRFDMGSKETPSSFSGIFVGAEDIKINSKF